MNGGTRPSNPETGLKEFELPLIVFMRRYVPVPFDLDNPDNKTHSHSLARWLFSDLMDEDNQPVGFSGPFGAIPPHIYRAYYFGTSLGNLWRGKGTVSYLDGRQSVGKIFHFIGPELEVPFIFGALTNASWLENAKQNRFHPRVLTFYDGLLALGPL
ncbi:hypothetical protein H0H93_002914 [Arthromyces matolae]|nr:hypothetical protein H0H93_002914 [Arthromyces matolae]